MSKADGSISFSVTADDSKAAKKLNELEQKIKDIEEEIEGKQTDRNAIKEQLDQADAAAEATRQKIKLLNEEMSKSKELEHIAFAQGNASAQYFENENQKEITAELARQGALLKEQETRASKIAAEVDKADRALEKPTKKLEKMQREAGKLTEQITYSGSAAGRMAAATEEASKRMEKLSNRVKGLVRSVFVFTLITSALRGIKDWFGNVIKSNKEASAAIAKLKGALLTLAQPLVNVVIPAFITLVNILTRAVSTVAKIVSMAFGTTAEESANAAEALYKQTEALEGTGKAAKKAGKSLASFDEINTLTDNSDSSSGLSDSSIVPDFNFDSSIDEHLQRIADNVLLIAAGLALWKIAESLPGVLGTISSKLGLIAIAIGGLLLLWNGLSDAWENGVDWGNMALMIGGTAIAAGALYAAFGKVGGGIALVVSGAAMVVTAFNDIIKNGTNLQNTLLMIAGIVATGLGFFLLTGSTIPLVIAGIASLVVAVLGLTGNLQEFMVNLKENILGGLIDFIAGVFTGDWTRAWEGIKKVFKGAWNAIVLVFESVINLIIKGLNWLISKLNKISFKVPDWVPFGIGGKSFGVNIKPIGELKLPRLASGTVIPPNREFLAVLGDQKSGTNIEAPLETIVQAFRKVTAESGNSGGGTMVVKLYIDGRELAENQVVHINNMTRESGTPVLLT